MEGFYAIPSDRSLDGVSHDMDVAGVGVVGKKNFGADNTGFFIAGRAGVQSVNTKLSASGYHHNGLSLNYAYNTGDLFNADVTAQTLTLGYEYRF